ncbi:MAG: hypothetical protein IPO42_15470 [Chitinophagaceae bacterium]|nr:hypothetical protein [Chitinophagaceae bacterium]
MIGVKIDIKAYQKTDSTKKKNVFSIEETLLTHYDTISKDAKKTAKKFFKENFHSLNGYKGLVLEEAIQQYLFEIKADVPFLAQI